MIPINSQIIRFLNTTYGYSISEEYYANVSAWKDWWRGFHEPFHRISFENGDAKKHRDMYTMRMAKKVCEDWAAILINDKTFVKIDDERSERFVVGNSDNGGVFGSNSFWCQANDLMEQMMWSGTAAVVIRLKNVKTDGSGTFMYSQNARIDLNYINAESIIPLTVDNGIITEAAFCSDICQKGQRRIYLEIHRLDGGEYIIENHIFTADKSGILKEDALPDSVPRVMRTGSDIPWFAICKPAVTNAIEGSNGMGCAIFADAVDNLKGIDLAYNNLNSDIWLGQKKVFLSKSMIADIMGKKVAPDEVNQQLFYYISETAAEDSRPLVQEHNPDLRVKDNTDCIQAQLDYLSFKCGFGAKHYQFNSGTQVTATQYSGDKQDLIMSAHKHFIKVETFLHSLVKSILWIGHSYIDSAVKADAHISVIFDQSPLIDEVAERERDRQDVHDRLMHPWEYRVKWYGESEDEAKKATEELSHDGDDLYGGDFE